MHPLHRTNILWDQDSICKVLCLPSLPYSLSINNVSIDSRNVQPGSLFIGIHGENFDGCDFIQEAFSKGAVACLANISHPYAKLPNVIPVHNTMLALEQMAKYRRTSLPKSAHIICITGSVGKTTTKEMLKLALSQRVNVFANEGNLNNQYGLPLSLCNMPVTTEYCILEMGMNHAGEIEHLSNIAMPTVSVITNVTSVHAEFFDSIDGIAYAKSEIYKGMKGGDIAIINADSEYRQIMLTQALFANLHVITFGINKDADFRILDVAEQNTHSMVRLLHGKKMTNYKLSHKLGAHMVLNSAAVIAAACAVGLSSEEASCNMYRFQALKGRGKTYTLANNILLIDDSYNANPESVIAGLATLAGHRLNSNNGRRIAILGDMKELGAKAVDMHLALASIIQDLRLDKVHTVGPMMQAMHNILPISMQGVCVSKAEQISCIIPDILRDGDLVLVKGSFAMKMVEIVEAIRRHYGSLGN